MNKDIKLKKSSSGDTLYRVFIYVALITLAVTIIVPVAWVFMASVKQNSEFYGNPWTLPAGFYWQNFVDAWTKARMGEYMLNSVVVTALALGILLIVALPAAYVLSRFNFRGRGFFNTAFMGGLFINVNYIVVPIFLMFVDGDKMLRKVFGTGFFLNNIFVLALVYMRLRRCRSPSICCPAILLRCPRRMKKPLMWTARVTAGPCCALSCPWLSPASLPSFCSTFSRSGTSTSLP